MKKKEITIVRGLILVYSMLVCAQGSQAAKPRPEHEKLAVFLGSWSAEGEYKVGNGYEAPAGKMTQVERWEWLPGESFIQMSQEGKGPEGAFRHAIICILTLHCTAKRTVVTTSGAQGLGHDRLALLQLHSSGWGGLGSSCESRHFGVEVDDYSYGPGCETDVMLAPGPHRVRVIPLPLSDVQATGRIIEYRRDWRADAQRVATLSFTAEPGRRYEISPGRWSLQEYPIRVREQGSGRILAEGLISWTLHFAPPG